MDINPLCDVSLVNMLSHSLGCLSFYWWFPLLCKTFTIWCSPICLWDLPEEIYQEKYCYKKCLRLYHLWFSFLGFLGFHDLPLILQPTEFNSCVWCKKVVEFHVFACYPIFPTLFIEKTIFTPLYVLVSFVKYWLQRHRFISGLSILFHWSVCLFLNLKKCLLILERRKGEGGRKGEGREVGKERDGEREALNIDWLPHIGDRTCNLGLWPDWESNPQHFGLWEKAPTNWATPARAIGLLLCQYHGVLITKDLQYSLIWYCIILPTLFFLLKIAITIWGLLWFHTNVCNICSNSVNYAIGILMGIVLNL